jgi:predicted DNA-binding ribbon-helix-helix protein
MHTTTVNLRTDVWLRLRNRAQREGVPVGTLVNDLLAEALVPDHAGGR